LSEYEYKDIRTEREEEEKTIHELDAIGPGYQESPLAIQIGGDHYKDFNIQPIEFITRNKLGFIQGCVVKRICRYNVKGGKGKEDLLKIKHEIDVLLTLEVL